MAKKAAIQEMAELYERGMTLQEIGDRYGISRQRVQQRFKDTGFSHIERPPKFTLIDTKRLETLYLRKRLSVAKIGEALKVKPRIIRQALEFHKIPKRRSLTSNGKYIDRLRELKIGENIEIVCCAKKPYVVLHFSAKRAGGKVSVKKLASGKFQVTRIS